MGKIRLIYSRIVKDIKDYRTAIAIILVYIILMGRVFHTLCPFVIITGFPCAGCGITRAFKCLLTLDIRQSLAYNPSAPLWLAFIIWFAWNRYVLGTNSKKKASRFLAVICIITLIIYICRMITDFPSNPPMVYYRDNLFLFLTTKLCKNY